MANYVATNGSTTSGGTQQAIAAAYTQATLAISNSTANGGTTAFTRAKVYDILVGTAGVPADSYMEWQVVRTTSSSTSTFITTNGLDPADANANHLVVANSSQIGTVAGTPATIWYVGMNQRASYRWVCAPGSELVLATTSSAGLVLQPRGTATVNPTATWFWQQQ